MMMGGRGNMIRWGAALVILVTALAVYMTRPAAEVPAEQDMALESEAGLPRLLDLGADKCVPCKMMAPILDELKVEYAEIFAVEFIDVWKNPDQAQPYGLKVIPTQIFYSAEGEELWRHEGFFGRDDILAKWQELGVDVTEKGV